MTRLEKEQPSYVYYTMISDIKSFLLTAGKSKSVKTDEFMAEGKEVISLHYDESRIGLFIISITSKAVDEFKSDYFIHIDFQISNSNKPETIPIDVPMFSEQPQELSSYFKQLLELFNYVNCLNDSNIGLQSFMKNFPKFSLSLLKSSDPNVQNFSIAYENSVANGFISYTKPQGLELGKYTISLSLNNEVIVNKDFQRMSQAKFQEFLKSLDLFGKFKSIYELIKEIFKTEFTNKAKESKDYSKVAP